MLFFIYNDHVTSFFFDHYSHFALGIGDEYPVADEGGGPRAAAADQGAPRLAHHIAAGLVADEFDLSYFQGKGLDHGCVLAAVAALAARAGWPGAIVPLQVGVLEFPIPSARRCFKLGRSLRKAIQSYPEDIKVAIVGTGGLSHQVHGERSGFNNTPWDMEFMDLLEKDPEEAHRHHDRRVRRARRVRGRRGDHVADHARCARRSRCSKLHQTYYLPSMTPIATRDLRGRVRRAESESVARVSRAHRRGSWSGIEKLPGTYPFTLDRSVKAYRLNDFLHRLIEPEFRKQFLGDPEAAVRGRGADRGRARSDPAPRLARADPLRRDLLRAREARRRDRH